MQLIKVNLHTLICTQENSKVLDYFELFLESVLLTKFLYYCVIKRKSPKKYFTKSQSLIQQKKESIFFFFLSINNKTVIFPNKKNLLLYIHIYIYI